MAVNVVLVNGNTHAVVPGGSSEGWSDEELHAALSTGQISDSWLLTTTGTRVATMLIAEVPALA